VQAQAATLPTKLHSKQLQSWRILPPFFEDIAQ